MSYLYMSSSVKNLLGYESKEIMAAGPEFLLNLMHPDDLKELMGNTFKKLVEYYHNTPLDQKKHIRSSYDYRIKRADGKYARLLQQTVVVDIDKDGNPLVDIGIISDITEYKKDNKISLLISRYDQTEGFVTLNTPPDLEPKKDRISQRELEILKLLMQGFSSKKIADELHISINTVKNHRQNLLEKTKSKNIAELITFALSNSII
jgi:DNA-binding CsgD family transcriptional regulator